MTKKKRKPGKKNEFSKSYDSFEAAVRKGIDAGDDDMENAMDKAFADLRKAREKEWEAFDRAQGKPMGHKGKKRK